MILPSLLCFFDFINSGSVYELKTQSSHCPVYQVRDSSNNSFQNYGNFLLSLCPSPTHSCRHSTTCRELWSLINDDSLMKFFLPSILCFLDFINLGSVYQHAHCQVCQICDSSNNSFQNYGNFLLSLCPSPTHSCRHCTTCRELWSLINDDVWMKFFLSTLLRFFKWQKSLIHRAEMIFLMVSNSVIQSTALHIVR